jgi:7,8-dihydroneopterin aldolase/epimerase/oxygenase
MTEHGLVKIRNLEFQANHGATAGERRSARRFQVDVDLTLDLRRAMESDRLADTINYKDVCEVVVEIGTSRPYKLLERVAAAMVSAIAERWPHTTVELELRKLHPPCPGNPDYTAVRVRSA